MTARGTTPVLLRATGGALVAAVALLGAEGAQQPDATRDELAHELHRRVAELREIRARRAGLEAEATFAYRELTRRAPADAEAWIGLGNALAARGDVADAACAYETAWLLGRRDHTIARLVANLEQHAGDRASAIRWLERARERSEEEDAALDLRLAQLLASDGRTDRAPEVAVRVAGSGDAHAAGRAELLRATLALRDERLDAAAAKGAHGDTLSAALGRALFARGAYADSVRRLDADASRSAYELSLLLRARIRAGDLDGARDALRRYLEHHGLDETARARIRELSRAVGDAPADAGDSSRGD